MEYFQKTSPEKFRFIDFYKYRQRQDDFTRSFREESGNLWRCLMSLVKDGTPQVKENATDVRLATEVPRRVIVEVGVSFAVLRRGTYSHNYGRGFNLLYGGFPLHRTKLEDVRIFWQQIENETTIDDAEAEVACKFIRRSSKVIDVALTNVEEKMKQNRKHADKEGECSTRRLGDSTSDDYDINLSETDFSDMNHEEKEESNKRKQSESDYEPNSNPTSSDSDNNLKKKVRVRHRNYCSSQIQTNKNEDNPAPAINPNNVIISQYLPTLVNQDQLSTLTVTNPIIQTPGTPPPRPNVNNIQVTPQKSVLFKESVTYLQNHINIDVNDQGMIIKDNHTSEEISSIIRNWLIMALTSPKEEFVKAIMSPLSSEASPKDHDFRQICEFILYDFYFMTKKGPLRRDIGERTYIVERIVPLFKAIQSVYNEYKFHWIEVESDCIREVKQIFSEFDLPINQADGLGMRNSSNKAVVFIEVLGGPENTH
ncbi:12497_t:CDS:10, partial [Acaulospora morrowiae]